MKRIIGIFGFLILFAFTCLCTDAKTNYLRTITLEKNNTSYNVILSTDTVSKIVKKITNPNELVLELNGVTSSDTVNAIYKGANNIESLVVEHLSQNKIRVYITAENISLASIMLQTSDGVTSIAGESFPWNKVLWAAFVLFVFSAIFSVSKKILEEDDKILIKKDIKDREIAMYKNYRRQMDQLESSKLNKTLRMKTIMKKIDRKIDERLTSSIR